QCSTNLCLADIGGNTLCTTPIAEDQACNPNLNSEQCTSNYCIDEGEGTGTCAVTCDSNAADTCGGNGGSPRCINNYCVELSSLGGACDNENDDCIADENLVCTAFPEPGPFWSAGGDVCLYSSATGDVGCESNFDCTGGYCDGTDKATGTGVCTAVSGPPPWYAVDLSDQPGFIDDATGPMGLTLTGLAHPALIYSAENKFIIQHYDQDFSWADILRPGGDNLFTDLAIISGNALAAVNHDPGANNVIKTLRYNGDGTEDVQILDDNINASTRPVIAALEANNGTVHAYLAFVDTSGALVIQTYDSGQTDTFAWSNPTYCDGGNGITNIATNTARDIDIEAIGDKVAIVYRKNANTLGFAINGSINNDNCWKTDFDDVAISDDPAQNLVKPQISFIKSAVPGNNPYPIVAWHEHSDDESLPKRDTKMAIYRINAGNPAWSNVVDFYFNNQNTVVTGASHDLPQIVGDNINANNFYLAWRRCATKRCDYNGGEAAGNFSTRLVQVTWPEGENSPNGYNDIDNSNDEGLNNAPGVREIRLVVDDERMCIATYHEPLIQGNDGTSGNIYLVCHDAL
ncbi:MAG: hypothetical protein QGI45_11875, partial [Myxococcota bacterium]|nr:hypothetical protein [Myxococcota bacterium]